MKRKSKIKRQMFTMGELMLIVGIVVIFLAVGIGLAVVKGGVGGPLGKAREDARRVNCTGNLKQFGQAFANYTSAGENFRPTYHGGTEYGTKALEILITSGELTDLSVYICPSSNLKPASGSSLEGHVSYAYIPGLDVTAGADSGIMADGHTDPRKPNHEMYGNILFGDGHVAPSTGTSSKNWIKSANWVTTTASNSSYWGPRVIIDESWLETRTDKSFQIGPRIK